MEDIKKIIERIICESNNRVKKIILFGSRARGTFDENSDYDILVILENDMPGNDKIKLACIITKELANKDINADIIVKSSGEIERYKKCIGSVVRNALIEGVTI